jgi:hypothetical protein
MAQVVPASRKAMARVAFIRALAKETDVIHELRALRLPPIALEAPAAPQASHEPITEKQHTRLWAIFRGTGRTQEELMMWLHARFGIDSTKGISRDRYDTICTAIEAPWPLALEECNSVPEGDLGENLTLTGPHHHVSAPWMSLPDVELFRLARVDCDCVDAATAWTLRWKLGDTAWLHKWAMFALGWWDVARRCTVPECPHACQVASGDDDMQALALVLTPDTMRRLEAADGNEMTFTAQLNEGGQVDADGVGSLTVMAGGRARVPIGIGVVAPLPGPNPLLETKSEFLDRAVGAWDEEVAELLQRGIAPIVPRKLDLHCEWLVRYHVQHQTIAEIMKDLEDTDPSTVYKAVRSVAQVIGLTVRET